MPRKHFIYVVAILLVSHFLLIILTFRDYGMCWDQPGLHHYGQAVIRFYTSLGRDDAVRHDDLRLYGGLFEIVASAIQSLSHLGWLEAYNLTSALFGLLGIWALFRLGEIAFGPIVGVTAALFLTLTPTYYGHEFINPKDIPFAALYSLSLYYIVKTGLAFPNWQWSISLKAGLAIGGTLGVRAGGLILFPLLIGTLFASLLWSVKRNTAWSLLRNILMKGTFHLVTILIVAWSVMLLTWPFAWKPHRWIPFLKAPFVALAEFTDYPWNSSVFFEGQLVRWDELPRNYLITLFINGLPEFILGGWLLGLVTFAWLCYRKQIVWNLDSLGGGVLFVAGAAPLAAIIGKHAPLYDNFRHVLFTIPPLTILAAAGVWAFLNTFRNKIIRLICIIGFTIAIVSTIGDMWALHPYEYTYFNRLVAGGMQQANKRFEMEYWGTSFREAAIWLKQNYRPPGQLEVIYDSNALREMTDYFMQELSAEDPKFRFPAAGEKAKLYLFFRRGNQLTGPRFGHVIHTIEREGVPFLDVVEI